MMARAGAHWVAVVLTVACVGVAAGQAQPATTNSTLTPMGRAMMAERNGNWADAAAEYAAVLKREPANLGALVGMEHVLPRLDRRAELLELLRTALATDSTSVGVLGVVVRVFATSGDVDSARKYVATWAARAPGDADPYREWSEAALLTRDLAQARLALDIGREKLGPTALGIERAELLQRTGDVAGAAREWLPVIRETPAYREGAVSVLVQIPPTNRQAVRDALTHDGSLEARQLLGLLLVRWGESAEGTRLVRGATPASGVAALALLHELDDELQAQPDRLSMVAHAATLEAIAANEQGAAAAHTLLDAARAYADAGDERNARRMLTAVAASPAAPAGLSSTASATLLGVLIAEGKPGDAEQVFERVRDSLRLDDRDLAARRIAMAWVRSGDLARAAKLVAADSSIEGLDLRGRLRLYRGDLAGANDLLKAAGPFDDTRGEALERVALLSLIQAIGRDSLPALGAALLALERGDTARAIAGLTDLAATLQPGGAAETRLLAARLSLSRHDTAGATALFHAADVHDFPATAAAARLALAELAIAAGDTAGARSVLEKLIIDFPESAVVPQARSLHDSLRSGAPGAGN